MVVVGHSIAIAVSARQGHRILNRARGGGHGVCCICRRVAVWVYAFDKPHLAVFFFFWLTATEDVGHSDADACTCKNGDACSGADAGLPFAEFLQRKRAFTGNTSRARRDAKVILCAACRGERVIISRHNSAIAIAAGQIDRVLHRAWRRREHVV